LLCDTAIDFAGNIKGGSIIVLLTSCLTGLYKSVLQIKTKIVSCHIADSKPVNVKQDISFSIPWTFPTKLAIVNEPFVTTQCDQIYSKDA
jgi:hypothetical protein